MRAGCLNIVSSWDWGSAPQWFTALVALGAAEIARRGLRNANRTYLSSVREQQRRAESERRDQARFVHAVFGGGNSRTKAGEPFRVSGWNPAVPAPATENGGRMEATEDLGHLYVVIRNDSEEVISDVTVGLSPVDTGADLSDAYKFVRLILPADEWSGNVNFRWPREKPFDLTVWRVRITFTDARGVTWERETGRPLEERTWAYRGYFDAQSLRDRG